LPPSGKGLSVLTDGEKQWGMENFRSIDELIRMLSREKVLLKDMFQNRKKLSYRYDTARELVEYKESRIAFLIDHGVIQDGGDFLELADVYQRFFEEVLDVNEDISVASVKESLDAVHPHSSISYIIISNKSSLENTARHFESWLRDTGVVTFIVHQFDASSPGFKIFSVVHNLSDERILRV
jgi:hypothetical protein